MDILNKQIAEIALTNNNRRLDAIQNEIAALKKEEVETLKANKVLKAFLNAPKVASPVPAAIEQNGYHVNWTVEQKIDFVLNHSESILTSRRIVEEVMKHEPAHTDRNKMMRSISSVLSVKSAEGGKYERGKNERNENTFSLKKREVLTLKSLSYQGSRSAPIQNSGKAVDVDLDDSF